MNNGANKIHRNNRSWGHNYVLCVLCPGTVWSSVMLLGESCEDMNLSRRLYNCSHAQLYRYYLKAKSQILCLHRFLFFFPLFAKLRAADIKTLQIKPVVSPDYPACLTIWAIVIVAGLFFFPRELPTCRQTPHRGCVFLFFFSSKERSQHELVQSSREIKEACTFQKKMPTLLWSPRLYKSKSQPPHTRFHFFCVATQWAGKLGQSSTC